MSSKRLFKRGDVVDIVEEYRNKDKKHMLVLGYTKSVAGLLGVSVSYGRGGKIGDFVWPEYLLRRVPKKYWNGLNDAIRKEKTLALR